MASPVASARVGVIVPKHGHSGVERNRLKRCLRELMRIHLVPTLPALDLVVRTLPSAYEAARPDLQAELLRAGARLSRALG